MKKLYIIIAVIVLSTLGIAYMALSKDDRPTGISMSQTATKEPTNNSSSAPVSENTLIIGDPNARVTIIEYADFKCPNCGKFYQQSGKQLRTDFIDKKLAKIEFRNVPFIASDSRPAAEGTYCANDQKKFVQYHDKIFDYMWDNYYSKDNSKEFENILTPEKLTDLSAEAGLDKTAFNQCLVSGKHKASVDADLKKSEQDGLTGTPLIIIKGQKVVGPQPYSTYKTLLGIALR